jgi:hypothetical protein
VAEHRLYSEDVDAQRCGVPRGAHTSHDDEMVLTSRCCLGRPTVVADRAGVLTLRCARCGRHVASLAVAARADTAERGLPPRR